MELKRLRQAIYRLFAVRAGRLMPGGKPRD